VIFHRNGNNNLEEGYMKRHALLCTALLVLVSVVFVGGCATMSDVQRVKEEGSEGTMKTYPVTADQAWDIAKIVFRWEGSDAIEEHRAEGYMLTSSGMNMVSWGAVMGAWIKPISSDSTEVTVVTKRRITVNLFTTLTEGTFHNRFAQAVAIVKKGEKLPSRPPAE
jgi:hypothetical protein